MRVRPLYRVTWLAIVSVAALWSIAPAVAQTGVDDDRVSLPEGPGSLEGFGDDVDIDPNMGSMSYSVPIELPPMFDSAAPMIGLSYNSGSGSGPVGIGWSMPTQSIDRMTARGVPTYTTDDYIDMGGDELVLVDDSDPTNLVYRMRFEGSFSRYRWVASGGGVDGYWVVDNPDGSHSYFGADSAGNLVDSARSEHPDGGTARYFLVETVDVWGHSVHYTYDKFDSTWVLLTGISWLDDGSGTDLNSVELTYEDRPDFLSDASVGFEELLDRRLAKITARAGSEIVSEYVLSYQEDVAAGGFSRLAEVDRYGVGGQAGGVLFPGVQRFDYSQALGVACAAGMTCERPRIVSMGTIPGGVDLGSGRATLVDIDADGLPDVLDTSNGTHRFAINRLTPDGEGFRHDFVDGGESALSGAGSLALVPGEDTVQVVDVNGDGLSDLLDTVNGSYLLNAREVADWGTSGNFGDVSDLAGLDFALARFIDIDDDKRIDIVTSTSTETRVYNNEGDTFVPAQVDALGMAITAEQVVQFADINGDGLNDPVEITSDGAFSYRLNLGHGHWGPRETIDGLTIDPGERAFVDLEDLNGDGISDVVVVSSSQVKYAINRNGARFDTFEPVVQADVDGGQIPERTSSTTVLYADMNANGSEDIVWFDQSGNVTYLELFPTRPNLLTTVDNSLGGIQQIDYGTAAEHAARARDAGEPWTFSLSIPMQVVDEIDLYVTLTGSADGSGLHNVTRYAYRDGFYDGDEKQYRGFERVVVSQPEIDSQESSETRLRFDVGREFPWRNGLSLESVELSGGDILSEVTTTWESCEVREAGGAVISPAVLEADGRFGVYFPCNTATDTLVKERLTSEADWVSLRQEVQYDGYGQVTRSANLGVVGVDGDEDYTWTTYVEPTASAWLLGLPSEVRHSALESPTEADTNVSRTYYDGEPFEGLPSGQATHGFVSRATTVVEPGREITDRRARRDDHGNVVEQIDANGTVDGTGHRRTYGFDETGLFLTTIDVEVDANYGLRKEIAYERNFGDVIEATDWMVVEGDQVQTARNSKNYRYDEFGRLTDMILPGDETDRPSRRFTYELGEPFSRVVIEERSAQNSPSFDELTVRCFDGRGRSYQERTRLDSNEFAVTGFTVFNARGETVEDYLMFLDSSETCSLTPPGDEVPSRRYRFDGAGRTLETILPGESIYGETVSTRDEYLPLEVRSYDAEDNDADGAHADTPVIVYTDGLGRTIAFERTAREDGTRVSARTELRYDTTNSFTGYVDADGNVHEMTVDLAGRITEVTNPDFGTMAFVYDDVGNVISTTDARGVTVRTELDGTNRLSRRYEEGNEEATLVTWSYDALPDDCELTDCTNYAGALVATSWSMDLGDGTTRRGVDHYGYDARGRNVYVGRRFGELGELATRREFDNQDRVLAITHPDGTVEARAYDLAGRHIDTAGFVSAMEYDSQNRIIGLEYANGARVASLYDTLSRVTSRRILDAGGSPIYSIDIDYDRVDHVTAVTDTAMLESGLSYDVAVDYDDWYRIREARLADETLQFTFDDIDRILSATSSDTASPAHRGELTYDEARPHAVISAGDLAIGYNEAGQVTSRGSLELVRDHMGRMQGADREGTALGRFSYDDESDRTVQWTADGTLVLYGVEGFELRDGVATTRIDVNTVPIAQHETTSLGASFYADADDDGSISAADAWLIRQQGADDGALSTRHVLAAAATRMLVPDGESTTFVHSDFQGSVIAATDEGGAIVGRRAYYPFGGVRHEEGWLGVLGFTAQEHDALTDTIHMGARELDPITGRWDRFDPNFVQVGDDLASQLGESTTGYAYVANSPLTFVDPTGLNKDGNTSESGGKTRQRSNTQSSSSSDNSLGGLFMSTEQAQKVMDNYKKDETGKGLNNMLKISGQQNEKMRPRDDSFSMQNGRLRSDTLDNNNTEAATGDYKGYEDYANEYNGNNQLTDEVEGFDLDDDFSEIETSMTNTVIVHSDTQSDDTMSTTSSLPNLPPPPTPPNTFTFGLSNVSSFLVGQRNLQQLVTNNNNNGFQMSFNPMSGLF